MGESSKLEGFMLRKLTSCFSAIFVLSLALTLSGSLWAQNPHVAPADRIHGVVDDTDRVTLTGSLHPLAKANNAIGVVSRGQRLERMILVLSPSAGQERALKELIRAQQDPASSQYHRWLTPTEFGAQFGASPNDVSVVSKWLADNGLQVEEVPASRRAIVFSGPVEQVETAFRTSIQKFSVHGEAHYANAREVQIPKGLSQVVRGVLSLHDFRSAPQISAVMPNYTAGNGTHYLSAMDWDTIYNVNPLLAQGVDGTGVSIAVLGRVDVAMSDVRTFRSEMSLPANDPQMIINGPDPGFPNCDDEVESALDVEWAGAVAKNATVKFVTSKSVTSDGIALSAQYAVANNVAPIISLSYGLCEGSSGSAGNAFWNSLWAQAASQGQSVFVSAGDSGAAGCDSPSQATGTRGRGVNALCTSPYSTCVGGTQFDDSVYPEQYWSASNGTGMSSALQYIPEVSWNESGWSGGLWSTGGGASNVYSKPSWQVSPGVPADGKRDVPDISASAAIHDAYIIQIQGQSFLVGGTSAAAPALASVMAMVNQKAGSAQGNANPNFYALANLQLSAGGAAVFHDVTSGSNSVPGVTGFNAGSGYDLATGLGSPDANLLVNHWGDAASINFSLSPSVPSLSITQGSSGTVNITLTATSGFSAPVTLSAGGTPSGVTVKFSSTTLTTSAPVTATITVAATAAAGNSTITVIGSGAGLTRSATVALTVTPPTFSLSANAASLTSYTGGVAGTLKVTAAAGAGFKSSIALSVSGLPTGVTASFSPSSIASPGNGSSTLTLTASATAAAGTYSPVLTAKGGNYTSTQTLTLSVVVPTFSMAGNVSSATVSSGSSTQVKLTTAGGSGFKSSISFTVSGLPKGASASFSPSSIASPGNGTSTMTISTSSSTAGGNYTVTVTGKGGNFSTTKTVSLTVVVPYFTLALSNNSVSVAAGGSVPVTLTTGAVNGFKSSIVVSVVGLPSGVTASFSPTSIASPGNGSSTLTLKGAKTATVGTSTLTVKATGGGVTQTQSLTLAVTAN
jgi:pseudomonalisin